MRAARSSHSDCLPPPVSGAEVGLVAGLVDALPLPGALLADGDGLRLVAGNGDFHRLLGGMAGRLPLLAGDHPVGRAASALLRDCAGDARRTFRWQDGDEVSGRHFLVTLARIEQAAEPACLLTLIDRTAEVANARSLRAELAHDSLTGLPNRAAFAEAVEEQTAEGGRQAVLLVDLARFSRINESLGVMVGDEAIMTVARRLLSTLRAGDRIARVGGNEFGLLIRVARDEDAIVAARRVRHVLATPLRLSRYEIGLDCAIGCALSGDGAGGEELVRHAQLALKRAKLSGRIETHTPGEAAVAHHRLDIETALRRAIDADELGLAFQPIVDLTTDRPVGFEALTRWTHPERGPIEPSEFIPVAEEAGLIVPLGRWAIDRALATLAGWDRAAGRPLAVTMSVNVSAIQLARDDVPGFIAERLAAHGLPGRRLTLELTESAIVQDPARAARALEALRALDVRVALDDFGTGQSSLAYLRRLPIDVLKIDRSFVSGMLEDRDKVAIVRAVLSLADALGQSTTAEGIETVELGRTLSALGCTHGQGFLYAPPLPGDEALRYLLDRNV